MAKKAKKEAVPKKIKAAKGVDVETVADIEPEAYATTPEVEKTPDEELPVLGDAEFDPLKEGRATAAANIARDEQIATS